jgi:predicted transposase YdaD
MAHRKTQDTAQDAQGRLRWKLHLIKRLYERGYSKQDILELFRLLDWMMRLPEQLELTFRHEIRQFEEEKQMPYISSIERLGREEGRQEGRREGRLEEREEIIRALLLSRFSVIDEELAAVVERLMQIPAVEFGNALSTLSSLSREELLKHFGENSIH